MRTETITPKRNTQIEYINTDVPDVTTSAPAGQRYTRRVPDTLDITHRGELALRAMTSLVEPTYDYEFYFISTLDHNPPFMQRTMDAITCQYKYQEATALLRHATGLTENLEVDQRWKETSLQRIGPDGLAYWPLRGRAFEAIPEVPALAWMEPCFGDKDGTGQICQPSFMGRLFAAMTLYHREDGNPVWFETAEKMIARLRELLVWKDGTASMPTGGIAPGAVIPEDHPVADGMWISHQGWLVQSLVQYARHSQSQAALELAIPLMDFVIGPDGMFGPNGEFTKFHHFHHHSQSIIAAADLALLTGEKKYAEFARKAYLAGVAMGDTLVGFFPEGLRDKDGSYQYAYGKESAETCEIADMITIALMLTGLGYDDCWDDADRWVRNQFAENQMMSSDWVYDRIEELKLPYEPKTEPWITCDHVAERHIGSFAGWPFANELIWFGRKEFDWSFMHCCTGNGSRVLYYIWQYMLQMHEGTLSVNLLMNRASSWADVDSHVPYTGQVDVHVKTACRLRMRLPEWVQPEEATGTMNGASVTLTFDGRYAEFGAVQPGDVAVLTFPIAERSVETTIGGEPYTLVIKGNDVVSIDPPGQWYPYYQRDAYRRHETQWVERERFAADETLEW